MAHMDYTEPWRVARTLRRGEEPPAAELAEILVAESPSAGMQEAPAPEHMARTLRHVRRKEHLFPC